MTQKVEIKARKCKECDKLFPATRKDREFCEPKHAMKYCVRKMRKERKRAAKAKK